MRWLTALIVLFTLAGCGLARQAQMRQADDAAKLQMARDQAECDRLHPNRKPRMPRIECRTKAQAEHNRALQRSGFNIQFDLVEAHDARVLLATEKYDKGELSEAEYRLAIANSRTAGISQENDRSNNAAAIAAQQQAAAAASQQAATAAGDSIRDAFKPKTTHTNCTGTGNSVNCTTY